jgi:hypothetical protein
VGLLWPAMTSQKWLRETPALACAATAWCFKNSSRGLFPGAFKSSAASSRGNPRR